MSSNNLKNISTEKCSVVLLDVAGTTTSLNFVKETLFPFVTKHAEEFLKSSWDTAEVKEAVKLLQESDSEVDLAGAVELVKKLTERGSDNKGVKIIQGLIYKKGYDSNELKAHVFPDVPPAVSSWSKAYKISIYSTGSVESQNLLFKHTLEGDLSSHIHKYFDQSVGNKTEAGSYSHIADKLETKPEEIVFITDNVEEAKAAKKVGVSAIIIAREGSSPLPEDIQNEFPVVSSFSEIPLEKTSKRKSEDEPTTSEEPPTKVMKVESEVEKPVQEEKTSTDEKSNTNECEAMEVDESENKPESIEDQGSDDNEPAEKSDVDKSAAASNEKTEEVKLEKASIDSTDLSNDVEKITECEMRSMSENVSAEKTDGDKLIEASSELTDLNKDIEKVTECEMQSMSDNVSTEKTDEDELVEAGTEKTDEVKSEKAISEPTDLNKDVEKVTECVMQSVSDNVSAEKTDDEESQKASSEKGDVNKDVEKITECVKQLVSDNVKISTEELQKVNNETTDLNKDDEKVTECVKQSVNDDLKKAGSIDNSNSIDKNKDNESNVQVLVNDPQKDNGSLSNCATEVKQQSGAIKPTIGVVDNDKNDQSTKTDRVKGKASTINQSQEKNDVQIKEDSKEVANQEAYKTITSDEHERMETDEDANEIQKEHVESSESTSGESKNTNEPKSENKILGACDKNMKNLIQDKESEESAVENEKENEESTKAEIEGKTVTSQANDEENIIHEPSMKSETEDKTINNEVSNDDNKMQEESKKNESEEKSTNNEVNSEANKIHEENMEMETEEKTINNGVGNEENKIQESEGKSANNEVNIKANKIGDESMETETEEKTIKNGIDNDENKKPEESKKDESEEKTSTTEKNKATVIEEKVEKKITENKANLSKTDSETQTADLKKKDIHTQTIAEKTACFCKLSKSDAGDNETSKQEQLNDMSGKKELETSNTDIKVNDQKADVENKQIPIEEKENKSELANGVDKKSDLSTKKDCESNVEETDGKVLEKPEGEMSDSTTVTVTV